MKSRDFSLIVLCFNDAEFLAETLQSLSTELEAKDELIVIDSSSDRCQVPKLLSQYAWEASLSYEWTEPRGVYAAQNRGIAVADGKWIQILGAGDRLLPGGRQLLDSVVTASPGCRIHVFGQVTGLEGSPINIQRPSPRGVWPHQSIVVASEVHHVHGGYDTTLRIVADQVFFAKVRHLEPWASHDELLTYYDLSGLSSRFNLKTGKELYLKWRSLGRSAPVSAFRGFLSPWARSLLERILGKKRVASLKRFINPVAYGQVGSMPPPDRACR